MLVSIGRRQRREDLVGLLLECHERIRRFASAAEALGARTDLDEAEVVDGCARCERYFTEALPLHVEDENESILPRLVGIRPELDDALVSMHAQHGEHEPSIAALLDALEAVREVPTDLARRERLHEVARQLRGELERHLELEERVVFPAVAELSEATQREIVDELRARRFRS